MQNQFFKFTDLAIKGGLVSIQSLTNPSQILFKKIYLRRIQKLSQKGCCCNWQAPII